MLSALKSLKLWQVIVLVVVTFGSAGGVYGIYSWTTGPSTPPLPANTQLVAVQYGNLVNTVSASGSLLFSIRERLTFGSAGTIQEMNVKVGDMVKKGQALAKLNSASILSVQKATVQARINLKKAEENLEKLQNPYTELDIAQAEAAIVNAKVAIETARESLEQVQNPYTELDIAQAEAAIINAKVAIETARESLEQVQNPYTELDIAQAEVAIVNAKVAIEIAQDNLDKARTPYTTSDIADAEKAVERARQQFLDTQARAPLNIADAEYAVYNAKKTYDDSFSRYLAGRLSSDDLKKAERDWERAKLNLEVVKQDTAWALSDAESKLAKAEETLAEMKAGADPLEVEQKQAQLAVAQANLAKAEETLAEIKAGADPLEVEQKQTQLAVAQANLAKATETLAEMKAGADPLEVEQKQTQLAVAQANLAKAKETLAEMKAGADPLEVEQKQTQLAVAQANLAKAKETLAEMKAGADPLNVEQKQLEVDSARAALDEALKRLEMATLMAPFGGIAASVNVEAGQAVNANAVAIELVDPSAVEVSAILDEIDVAQVKQGQKVTVSMDAMTDLALSGEVSTISVIARTQGGVVSYPLTIRVTPPAGVQLREGMSATASIVVEEVNDVLLIPNQAIRGSLNNPTVEVLVNGESQTRAVRLGTSDGLRSQVVAGLQEGDLVVVQVAAAGTTQQRLPRGLPGLPGGGFPGGGMR